MRTCFQVDDCDNVAEPNTFLFFPYPEVNLKRPKESLYRVLIFDLSLLRVVLSTDKIARQISALYVHVYHWFPP